MFNPETIAPQSFPTPIQLLLRNVMILLPIVINRAMQNIGQTNFNIYDLLQLAISYRKGRRISRLNMFRALRVELLYARNLCFRFVCNVEIEHC